MAYTINKNQMDEVIEIISEYIHDFGGCDHPVGICCCHELRVLHELQMLRKDSEKDAKALKLQEAIDRLNEQISDDTGTKRLLGDE